MIKKNLLLVSLLSVVWCSSSYSMDYEAKFLRKRLLSENPDELYIPKDKGVTIKTSEDKCEKLKDKEELKDKTIKLETSDKEIVTCDSNLCKFSTTIHNVIEGSGDYSTTIPMQKVSELTWNLLHPLIQFMDQGKKNQIQNKLETYNLDQLVAVLTAADYLDIRTPDDRIVLTDLVENEIVQQLLSEDGKQAFRSSNILDDTLNSISDSLSQKIVKHIMAMHPTIQERLLENAKKQCDGISLPFLFDLDIPGFVKSIPTVVHVIQKDWRFTLTNRSFHPAIGWECLCISNRKDKKYICINPKEHDKVIVRPMRWVGISSDQYCIDGHGTKFVAMACNDSGDKIVLASENGTLEIWDIQKEPRREWVCDGNDDGIVSVAFNSTGDKIVSASKYKTVKIWDVPSKKCQWSLGYAGSVYSAKFNSQGNKIVSASEDGAVTIWDVETGKCDRVLHSGISAQALSAEFNQKGDKIVSTHNGFVDRKRSAGWVVLWDVKSGKSVATIRDYERARAVDSATFNAKGDGIIIGYCDEEEICIKKWDISNLLSIENCLNDLTLEQALLLVCRDDALRNNNKIDFSKSPRLKKIDASINDTIEKYY